MAAHAGNGAVDVTEQREPVGLPPGQNCLGLDIEEEKRSASAVASAMPSLVEALRLGRQAILANTGNMIVAKDSTKTLIEKMDVLIVFLRDDYPKLLTKAIKDALE